MDRLHFSIDRVAFKIITVALLAGCSGSQPPIGALGATPQGPATHAERSGSWMLPEAKSLRNNTTAPLL
jgi:hypothetical protein